MLRVGSAIGLVGNRRAAAAAVPYQLVGRPVADTAAENNLFVQRAAFVVVAIVRVKVHIERQGAPGVAGHRPRGFGPQGR